MDFSSVQIDTTVPMTPKANGEGDDIKDKDEDTLEGEVAQPELKEDGPPKLKDPMQ